jgi:acetyltransferase-like isoleucine patch superfamily enzyme/glycosyltransferase involved in cell wall biosynthesis
VTLRRLISLGREAEPFELRVVAAARALAADGDHRVVLPTDALRLHKEPGELKIGLFGNLANNAYIFAKCLRRLGYDAELVIEDGWFDAFLLNRPFWEDVEAECSSLAADGTSAYEEGLAHEGQWMPPGFVRRVAYDADLHARYQGRYSAIPEVQRLYREAFGLDLPADRALVLAQLMGHWPYLLAVQQYDVIQFSGASIGMAAFCPRPYVVFPTGGDLFISPFEENLPGLMVRAAYRGADAIAFCEVNYPEYLDRVAPGRPRYFVPMMVDTETYRPGEEPAIRARWQGAAGGQCFLLSVCRQSWQWKANDRLIRAFARFHQRPEGEPWRLVLMGWGPDLEKTRQLIGQLGLERKVVWEPLCSKPLLRRRQRAADLVADQFVMPGYGTSVLESMAAGKPVVMAPADRSSQSYLDDPPPFVGASTEEEILAALSRMSDAAARAARGQESLAWVRSQHGFDRVGPLYVAGLWSAWHGKWQGTRSDFKISPLPLGEGEGVRADRLLTCRPHPSPLPEGEGTDTSARQEPRPPGDHPSGDGLWSQFLELHHRRRDEIRAKFSRSLPLADELVDRWERARFLGFGEGASVYDSALVIGDVKVGRETWIGPQCVIDGSGGLEIGSHCSIAAGVHIYSHDTIDWALSGGKAPFRRRATRIGDDCYIGPHAVIAAGVRIGNRCLVGALALVKTDLPDGSVAVGCPARIVGTVDVDAEGRVTIRYHEHKKGDSPLGRERGAVPFFVRGTPQGQP